MSPEQARGRAVDRRADVWAFGCVLYELLTAQKAYDGETVSDTLAAVLRAEPDWSALPASTPASVHKLLHRCLQKDPKKRLRDIGDVRLEIDEILAAPAEAATGGASVAVLSPPRWKRVLPWAIAALFLFATAFANWQLKREWEKSGPPVTRFNVTLPAELGIGFGIRPSLALSGDGRMLVYVAEDSRGERLLYLRSLDSDDSQPLPGTEVAYNPFFSPDGRWVGFFARGNQLRKVPVTGGVSQPLSEGGPLARGAFWGTDGFIYFNPGVGNGVQRVPENGGVIERLTTLDTGKNEQSHQWPELLPGGRILLFTVMAGDVRATRTDALDLRSGARRTLLENGSQARYLPSGHLLYVQGEYLMGAPFDPEEARLTGPAVRVLQQLTIDPAVWAAQFAVSANGSLAYLKGGVATAGRSFVWSDRKGTSKEVAGPARAFDQPFLSPDGRSLAVTIRDTNPDIWVYDLTRSALSRLSFAAGEDETPLWFPGGKRIAWAADRERRTILAKAADGSGEEEQLAHPTGHSHLNSISPDGRFLTFSQAGGLGRAGPTTSTGWDVWLLPLDGEKKPKALWATQFNESNAMFSSDGHWLAYDSDESGRTEVYVQPFPGPGGKWQVSTDGGSEPHWVPQRKEIVYRNGDRFYAVPVQVSPTFSAGAPQLLFEGPYRRGLAPTFGVTTDGQRILLLKEGQNDRPREVHVVLNWTEELKRLLPKKQ